MTLALNARTLPAGAYVRDWQVNGVLGASEEAVLYSAFHVQTGEGALLQEYFPADLAVRMADGAVSARGDAADAFAAGRETFLMQGAALAGLWSSRAADHLPRVRAVFAEGGSAYMVMERHDGVPLQSELAAGVRPAEDALISLFYPMAMALHRLHAMGICHHRIHPGLILREPFGLLLTGFTGGRVSRDREDDAAAAYSPIELLVPVVPAGPWSDIYSLAAVLYHCIAGTPPPRADTRLGDVEFPPDCLDDYSADFLDAITAGLACLPSGRPRSIRDWCATWPEVAPFADPQPEVFPSGHMLMTCAPRAVVEGGDSAPEPEEAGRLLQPGRLWSRRAAPYVLPSLLGVAMAGGVVIALSQAQAFFPEKPAGADMGMLSAGIQPAESTAAGKALSAPLLLLEHELAMARETQNQIDMQLREAEDLDWSQDQRDRLRLISEKVSKAIAEMEALYAAPDIAASKPGAPSFLSVLEQQGNVVRMALGDSWAANVAGYMGAAERLRTNADANYQTLTRLLVRDERQEAVLLKGTAATARDLLGRAFGRLKTAAEADAPPNPVAASRQLAAVASAFGEVQAQAAAIREALRSGRTYAAQRTTVQGDLAKERKEFLTALASARRVAATLEKTASGRESSAGTFPPERRAEALLRVREANRRLADLERVVHETPDSRGSRIQSALLEVRETERGLRGLLQEAEQLTVAGNRTAPNSEVLRLLSRADTRLARDYRRYAELQDLLAARGGIIRIGNGDVIGDETVARLYREMQKLAAIRERLARAHAEADARTLYQQFSAQHQVVDGQLDRLLAAAARVQRRGGNQPALR